MKKYFIGLAIIIAVVTFSAFSKPVQSKKAPTAQLQYWYSISSNTVTALYAEDMSEADIKAEGAPCNDNGTIVCLVGSDSPLTINSQINPDDFESDEKIAHN